MVFISWLFAALTACGLDFFHFFYYVFMLKAQPWELRTHVLVL